MTRTPSYPLRSSPLMTCACSPRFRSSTCGLDGLACGTRSGMLPERSATAMCAAFPAPGFTRCGCDEALPGRSTARLPTGARCGSSERTVPGRRVCSVRPGVMSSERRGDGETPAGSRVRIGVDAVETGAVELRAGRATGVTLANRPRYEAASIPLVGVRDATSRARHWNAVALYAWFAARARQGKYGDGVATVVRCRHGKYGLTTG